MTFTIRKKVKHFQYHSKIVKEKDPEGKPPNTVTTLDELQEKLPFIEWKGFIETYLGSGFKLSGSDVILLNNEFYFKQLTDLIAATPARLDQKLKRN